MNSNTPTPETDAARKECNFGCSAGRSWFYIEPDFARKLERERDEARKSYETVKDWAHRIEATLNTILDRCSDIADGTSDASADAKFANELIGLNNAIALRDVFSLRAERDQLRKVCDELVSIIDTCRGHGTPLIKDRAACYLALDAYNQLPHVKEKNK